MTYKGIEITVTEDLYFVATLDGHEINSANGSEIKASIDKFISRKTVTDRKRLHIPCISETGERTVVTGLHASNNSLLVTPKIKRISRFGLGAELYLDTPAVEELIQELNGTRTRVEEIEKRLRPFNVSDFSYSEGFDERMEKLEKFEAMAKRVMP